MVTKEARKPLDPYFARKGRRIVLVRPLPPDEHPDPDYPADPDMVFVLSGSLVCPNCSTWGMLSRSGSVPALKGKTVRRSLYKCLACGGSTVVPKRSRGGLCRFREEPLPEYRTAEFA